MDTPRMLTRVPASRLTPSPRALRLGSAAKLAGIVPESKFSRSTNMSVADDDETSGMVPETRPPEIPTNGSDMTASERVPLKRSAARMAGADR
eukprot:4616229-Prymnesium_polylepis.1